MDATAELEKQLFEEGFEEAVKKIEVVYSELD